MPKYIYQIDDELRVVQNPEGYEQVGMKRSISAPSEALMDHAEAVKEFKDGIEKIESEIMEELTRQEFHLEREIAHAEFFLKETTRFHWDDNPMFDRLRLKYIDRKDSLEKEMRSIRIKRLTEKAALAKAIRDARVELSPFNKFIR